MPWTNFPNGISVTTQTGNVSGLINATAITLNSNTGTASGSITANSFSMSTATSNVFVGERAYLTFNFTSAAATLTQPTPFSGQVIDCWTTADTTPRTCSAFTLQAGSAGAVYVATVNTLVFATAVGQQVQPTLTAGPITTASSLVVVVTTAGSAVNFQATVVLQRTA